MDATDRKNSNGAAKSGTLTRKISSALRALSDFNVIRDWITEQAENDTTNISKVKLEIEK